MFARSLSSRRPSFLSSSSSLENVWRRRQSWTHHHHWPLLSSSSNLEADGPPSWNMMGHAKRWAGGWNQRGYDITEESLYFSSGRPKVVLDGYGPTGFTVSNIVKNMGEHSNKDGSIFFFGSIMAFPNGCFLWNVETAKDITMESLTPILLHRPKIDLLLIGSNSRIPHKQLHQIIEDMRELYSISVEQMEVFNAIGTFNFLNAEDREVAVVLLLDPKTKIRSE